MKTKKLLILLSLLLCAIFVSAKKKPEIFTVIQGDPLVILQEKKTAIFEIDYSKMMVTNGKDHDYDLPFHEWMISQDEDDDEWLKDWKEKDSTECNKAFREYFNEEIKNGIKLTKLGKDYNVRLRFNEIYIGEHTKAGKAILSVIIAGGAGLNSHRESAIASGELEIQNLKTGEVELVLAFANFKGEESISQIGRIKGIFENLSEEINEYLEDYQKQQKKLNKKKK